MDENQVFLTKSKNTRTWGQGYPLKFTREKLRTNNGQPHFTQRVKNLRNGLPLHKCFLLVLGAVGDAKVIRLYQVCLNEMSALSKKSLC